MVRCRCSGWGYEDNPKASVREKLLGKAGVPERVSEKKIEEGG